MLDWLKEILGEGYTPEIDQKISAAIGRSFVAKADFDANNNEAKQLKGRLEQADQTIARWEQVDVDGLRRQVEEYRRQAENARFDARLDLAIVRAGGRSEKAVRALLDLDALQASQDPDREIGRALEQLRAESGYLFAPALPAFAAGAGTMAPAGCADPLRAAFGLE